MMTEQNTNSAVRLTLDWYATRVWEEDAEAFSRKYGEQGPNVVLAHVFDDMMGAYNMHWQGNGAWADISHAQKLDKDQGMTLDLAFNEQARAILRGYNAATYLTQALNWGLCDATGGHITVAPL